MKPDDILKIHLWIVKFSGNNPFCYGWGYKLNATFTIVNLAILTYLLSVGSLQIRDEVDAAVAFFQSFTVCYQYIAKGLLLIRFKKQIAETVDDFASFWSTDLLGDEPRQTREIQTRLKLYKYAILGFLCNSAGQLITFLSIPLLSSGRELPFALWVPRDSASPYYEIVLVLEIYTLLMLICLVVGTDSLFIFFCGSLAIQFKLLAHKLRNLNCGSEEDVRRTVKECVVYHRLLLRCYTRVVKIYRFTLFCQYVLIITTICMNMFILAQSDDLYAKFNGMTYLFVGIIELNIYCIMSETLTDESSKLVFAIYESDWYNLRDTKIVHDLRFAMMGMKKPLVFRILGLIPLNMECYITMLKAAISYYALMVQLKME